MALLPIYKGEIRHSPLFSALDEALLDTLLHSASLIYKRGGETLFLRDGRAEHFYILRSGTAKLYVSSSDGNDKTIEIIQPGDAFSISDMFLDNQSHSMNCQLLEESNIFAFSSRPYLNILKENPDISFSIMADLSRKMQSYVQQINSLSLHDARYRFANYLLSLLSESADSGDGFHLPIHKSEIASLLSIKRETLSRMLATLSREQIIRVQGDHIRVLDIDKLKESVTHRKRDSAIGRVA